MNVKQRNELADLVEETATHLMNGVGDAETIVTELDKAAALLRAPPIKDHPYCENCDCASCAGYAAGWKACAEYDDLQRKAMYKMTSNEIAKRRGLGMNMTDPLPEEIK